MATKDVYDDMNFYVLPDKFVIVPNGKSDLLIIDRISTAFSVQSTSTFQVPPLTSVRRICGVLGAIKLLNGYSLLVATHRLFVGVLNGQAIWRLAGYDVIPYIPNESTLNEKQKLQNDTYLTMVRRMLDTPFLYFSYSYDLSHTLQRLHSMPPEFLSTGLFERGDSRFVWNGFVLKSFNRQDMRKYCLPLVLGFVSINQLNINGHLFSWSIISRRSVQHAGTRLYCRGIDQYGHCANFCETEQIVEFGGEKVSFVQTRGSIPLYWQQMPNLKYKPKPRLEPGKDHLAAANKHFDAQLQTYGRQVLVNLIDHRGAEDLLEKSFANLVNQMNNAAVRYEPFDFHSECKKMRWDRLNILIDRLAHEQDEFAYFHLRRDGALLSLQDGVFRTNCIDCLDRTNVVQSMLAKRSLEQSLKKLGILRETQNIDSTVLEHIFKGVWADNADMISTQYSGTGALKTDFTRTGKRTKMGLVRDGVNSLTRYYLNNFNDGFRQDSFDMFLGNYIVQDGEGTSVPCPLVISKGWKYGTFPGVLLFAVAMFFASAVFPAEYDTEHLLFLLFWGAMVGVTAHGILRFGVEFVDWPKLVPPAKVEA